MIWYTEAQCSGLDVAEIGGKANNLFKLKDAGFNVPAWVVIPQSALINQIKKSNLSVFDERLIDFILASEFSDDFTAGIVKHLDTPLYFAVRSSAVDEDSSDLSFAGQYDSYLYITKDQLVAHIKKVWCSAFSRRVLEYKKASRKSEQTGIAVVIQQMIPSEVSGVAFGVNPVSGERACHVISSVYGLGEGIVSGILDADQYVVKENDISAQIVRKTHQIVFDEALKLGTAKIEVPQLKQNLSSLTDSMVLNISDVLERTGELFGKPQDIEFAVIGQELYLLQARPVTNLHKIPDPAGEYILWDNSNIIESYPGVTTPLTFSFISKSYESAYKFFSEFMGVSREVIEKNERVFANTLGLIHGRVYYNLKTWYHMLAMLPGYSINARFMEKMMGVKEKFDIPESYRLSKANAWWSILKMVFKMYWRYRSLPAKRKRFVSLLNDTLEEYKRIHFDKKDANQLMQLYLDFEKKLIHEWKAPLLNDFFAMVWFGMLQKRCEKYLSGSNPNIHNDLLCGSSDIISTQPIHRSIALATSIAQNPIFKKAFIEEEERSLWHTISNDPKWTEIKMLVDKFIQDFGERCVGELKLETISYSQDPSLLVRLIKSYVTHEITVDKTSGNIEEQLRKNAVKIVKKALRYRPIKKIIFQHTLNKARELVSARENLRYERTRAFGIVREIFTAMGKRFYAEGILEDPRDIFYLGKEEIFSFIEGTSITAQVRPLVSLRKTEFNDYKKMTPPSERFATYGPVYHANDFYKQDKIEVIEGDLKGIGCCPGRVKARIKVVDDPTSIDTLDGCILVTSSTDPGWVTLFPSAGGIIVERGSLLSHSAIVSREMGIPCIVGVTGLLKTLRSGDEVEMDGSTGEIKIILKSTENS